jgi:NADPH2:quinone reductase
VIGFAMFNATPDEQRISAEFINATFEQRGWNPQVGQIFPLSEAAAAHQLQEDNTLNRTGTLTGKIVLTP